MLTEIEPGVDTCNKISLSPAEDNWQKDLREAYRSVPELLAEVGVSAAELPWPVDTSPGFALRVPASFVRRMTAGDPFDPLLLQVLPSLHERQEAPGFVTDPLAEVGQSPVPGLIHKYRGRVLILVTEACAVHCRYCFRQHFPYTENRLSSPQWQGILNYLRQDSSISEVIFSGGDPLSLSNEKLSILMADLATIPHLTTIRFHSRTPVVLPSRVDTGLIDLLTQPRWRSVLVLHANHARELNEEVARALAPLRAQGVTLLNQAVLLAAINDSLDAQVALSQRLFTLGVLPYYLHLLDPVAGAAHFYLSDTRAQSLWLEMQAQLPGYLLPRLVREEPGRRSKTWMTPGRD